LANRTSEPAACVINDTLLARCRWTKCNTYSHQRCQFHAVFDHVPLVVLSPGSIHHPAAADADDDDDDEMTSLNFHQ